MQCASCQRDNRAGARFCSGCGSSLAPRCLACGAAAAADARFCDACGAALAADPGEKAIARKVVTVVFGDLIGSMALHERRDAESARRLTDRYHRAMTAAIELHGGRMVQLLGDGVLAAFGVPRVAEDDAIRAVRAAVGMQRAFRQLAQEQGGAMEGIGLRVAVNTGEIVVSDDETAVIGDASNVAARLQHEARDGDVLIGEATQRLVGELVTLAPLGSFALRGREEAVEAYRVVSLERPARAQALAFVGRDEELSRMLAVYEAACSAPGPRLVVLLGSPGLGKSRLLGELTRRVGPRASVLAARCDQAPGATFAPLAEALRAFLRIEEGAAGERLRSTIEALVPGSDAERARIASGIAALLSGAPSPPEKTFFVVRRFLTALAAVRPVVLAIDDLHWAEPLLLDLVEHLVQWSAGVPLLLVAAARPELREMRSSLVMQGPLVADVVTLAGLAAGSAMRLAASVIGASELPAALAGRVLTTSEGNPLFVAELVRMLVQDGALRREGERWVTTVELASLEMPPTIQVLLAARLERLRPEERAVLERAAIVGRQFSRAAVAHLLAHDAGALDARLEALRRSELIEPDSAWFLGEPGLRFHHALIRDAAYRRVLRQTRAELHERFAEWVAGQAGDSLEHDETLGWHFEQAHENLRELGALDARGRSLGERAARHLGRAGRRALARDDVSVAAGLLGRALACLDADAPARSDLARDWCEALLSAGDVGPAQRAVAELGRLAAGSERLRAWHTCFRGQLAALTDPAKLRSTAGEVASAAQALAALADAAGEAKAHSVHAFALARLGEIGGQESALDRALSAARRANDRRLANAAMAGAPQAALWGPTPVTRASGRCLDTVRVLRITQNAPAVEAVALRCQALLEELRGRSDAARRMIAASRQMVEELGLAQQIFEADVFAGHIELLEGDAAAAERCLRGAYDGLRAHGLGIDAARAGALLGRALLAQDRATEAEALSHDSEALAGDDLKAAMGWRGVRAEAFARRGDYASAIELARAAVEIGAKTDDLLDHADARISFAVTLRAAGRGAEADAEERRALELWEQKGATLLVERARREAGRAPVEPAVAAPPLERRVRRRSVENWATALMKRFDAELNAGEVSSIFTRDTEIVHHQSGRIWRGAEEEANQEVFLRSSDLGVAHVQLGALGAALALFRWGWSASASAIDEFATGPVEGSGFTLTQASSPERAARWEIFAEDRLDEALVRLYERHAELLAEGPPRERAAGIARSVASLGGPVELGRLAAAFAPDVEFADRRPFGLGTVKGSQALLEVVRAIVESAPDSTNRLDDVLALEADAVLLRTTNAGTDRSAGPFERHLLRLLCFAPDGRVRRMEQFDADADLEALARLDELGREASRSAPRRRLNPNAATANVARTDAAVAAHDEAALDALFGDEVEFVDHVSGTRWDREGVRNSFRALLRAKDPIHRDEPLATLGDSLVLFRRLAPETSTRGGAFDVGAYEVDVLSLIEVDAGGRLRGGEQFASDRLGAALARLYARYAALLPEGPERACATGIADSVAAFPLHGAPDLDRYAGALAPELEFVDHRTTAIGSTRGAARYLVWARSLWDVADGISAYAVDVLAARPDALLLRWANSGTARIGGGPWERELAILWVFGDDGRVERVEQFDSEQSEEALARFDALVAAPPGAAQRVRSNAATASADRLRAALAAGDMSALAALYADEFEIVHYPLHARYGREEALAVFRATIREREGRLALEPVAAFGDRIALLRYRASASGSAGRSFDFGAYEVEYLLVAEVDARGLQQRAEFFAPDAWADAVVCLYERYAALLPEGRERTRATALASSVAAWRGSFEFDRLEESLSEAIEVVDHRKLGTWSARGKAQVLANWRSQFALASEVRHRDHHFLALRPDAFVVRMNHVGTVRATGGSYELALLGLFVFGSDGLFARAELFDPEREADALARFDELPAERQTARLANAATRAVDAFVRAQNARDWPGVVATFAPDVHSIDRRPLFGGELSGDAFLGNLRVIFDMGFERWGNEILATRGDRLCLVRGRGDAGGAVVDFASVNEVDERGRQSAIVTFEPDDLDAAYAELEARFASGEGRACARALAQQRAWQEAFERRDFDALAEQYAAGAIFHDHRKLGAGALSVAQFVDYLRVLVELAPDARVRVDHWEGSARAALMIATMSGTRDGGPFEMTRVIVRELGARGEIVRDDHYDLDDLDTARARYAELSRSWRTRFENAATRSFDRTSDAIASRDWETYAREFCAEMRYVDRRRLVQLELDRSGFLDFTRDAFEARSARYEYEPLATRGDRLALTRSRLVLAGRDTGPSEIESLVLGEVNADGRRIFNARFGLEGLDAAYDELEARYAAGEGRACARALDQQRAWMAALELRDLDAVARHFSAGAVVHDRRRLGLGAISGAQFVEYLRALVELAPDVRLRVDHWEGSAHGSMTFGTMIGTRDGGAFDMTRIVVRELGARGEIVRDDHYDLDDLDTARARYAELGGDPLRVPPNAARLARDRSFAAAALGDWEGMRALASERFGFEDRSRRALVRGDHQSWIESFKVFQAEGGRARRELIGTAGDRLALERVLWEGAGSGTPFGVEQLIVSEVEPDGRLCAVIRFDFEDRAAAFAEMQRRFAVGEGAAGGNLAPITALQDAAARRDWEAVGRCLADDFAFCDHRALSLGTLDRATWIESLRAEAELAPDVTREVVRVLAWNERGRAAILRRFGTLRDGGPFENVFVTLSLCAGGRILRNEIYDVGESERALARFEELSNAAAARR